MNIGGLSGNRCYTTGVSVLSILLLSWFLLKFYKSANILAGIGGLSTLLILNYFIKSPL